MGHCRTFSLQVSTLLFYHLVSFDVLVLFLKFPSQLLISIYSVAKALANSNCFTINWLGTHTGNRQFASSLICNCRNSDSLLVYRLLLPFYIVMSVSNQLTMSCGSTKRQAWSTTPSDDNSNHQTDNTSVGDEHARSPEFYQTHVI